MPFVRLATINRELKPIARGFPRGWAGHNECLRLPPDLEYKMRGVYFRELRLFQVCAGAGFSLRPDFTSGKTMDREQHEDVT
ncbi:hypothetical protein NXC24_PB00492 (plasmid) [Rhizobium sp. NXC24]|nr:hypothetical protein NXC24_PB00492 [Rhizobium sp. NXC24]